MSKRGRKRLMTAKHCTLAPPFTRLLAPLTHSLSPHGSFARTAHSFACSALLASLARSDALIRLLTPKLMGE